MHGLLSDNVGILFSHALAKRRMIPALKILLTGECAAQKHRGRNDVLM